MFQVADTIVTTMLLALVLCLLSIVQGAYRLYRYAELMLLYGGDKKARDKSEWHNS